MSAKGQARLGEVAFHILVALTEKPCYGYAIRDAIEAESEGTVAPRAATVYRALSRLAADGLVATTAWHASPKPHPGRARKYYRITMRGRDALAESARHLRCAVAMVEGRLEGEPDR